MKGGAREDQLLDQPDDQSEAITVAGGETAAMRRGVR
jgi:hypothetical protein